MGTYAKTFEIPEDFPSILREFTKEAIRQQPDSVGDIYKFGRDYFDKLSTGAAKSMFTEGLPDGVGSSDDNSQQESIDDELGVITLAGVNKVETQKVVGTESGSSPMPDDALSDRIALLFQEADTDSNGTLSRTEFQEVFDMFGASIGLTPKHVLKIMAEADNNDNGVIEYREFLPVATEIIQAIIAKEQYSENKVIRTRRASAKLDVQDFLVKGLPRNELEASIQKIFRGADGDGSGALDRGEFLRCLKESGLGFTRREINLVLTLIDKNSDGIIDYQEFMPVCFSMIVEILSDKVQEIPEEEAHLSNLVYDLLLRGGGNNTRLSPPAASECLLDARLGLRFVQVPAIMSAVEEGEDGLVEAKEVADAVAGVMCALKELDNRQRESPEDETVNEFKATRHTEGFAKAAGLDAEAFEEKLVGVFKSKDDGDTGTLATKDAVRDAIKEAFPDLEPRQVLALSSLAEPREDGRFGYESVTTWGFRTLQEIQDQHILKKTVKATVPVE